jgi:hypothetical protein
MFKTNKVDRALVPAWQENITALMQTLDINVNYTKLFSFSLIFKTNKLDGLSLQEPM